MIDDFDSQPDILEQRVNWTSAEMQARLKRRYWTDRLFRAVGLSAVVAAGLFLFFLLANIIQNGTSGFLQATVEVDVTFDASLLPDPSLDRAEYARQMARVDMQRILRQALLDMFPGVSGRSDTIRLTRMLSSGARTQLRDLIIGNPKLAGQTIKVRLLAADEVDQAVKGNIDISLAEEFRKLKNKEVAWLNELQQQGRVSLDFNPRFLISGDSREPELVGVWGAVVGSALTLLVTLVSAFPIGLAAAIYLEEFAAKNRLTDIVEISINNLAAVPSIVFGLLGLAFFLGVMGMARSAPLAPNALSS